jgi:hypothetical protein
MYRNEMGGYKNQVLTSNNMDGIQWKQQWATTQTQKWTKLNSPFCHGGGGQWKEPPFLKFYRIFPIDDAENNNLFP